MTSLPLRATMRRLAERTLLFGAALGRRRDAGAGEAIVLAYHNVLPPGEAPAGDRSLHLPFADFTEQLDRLEETHDVVPLRELLADPGAATRRPRAVITFDDAYRGAVVVAAAELARRELPATIFVAPAFVGGSAFWWDEIGGSAGFDDGARSEALEALGGRSERILAWADARGIGRRAPASHERCASEDELGVAIARGGLTLASHSWSHPNLASLGGAELRRELARPLEWLRDRFGDPMPVISYPYGLYSSEVERAARAVGYVAGLAAAGGPVGRGARGFTLPRITVPAGVSVEGFRLRTLGIVRR